MVGLLVAAFVVPTPAWEVSMTGEAEFRYRYWSRTGDGDLFGGPVGVNTAGVATGTNGFAGPVVSPGDFNPAGFPSLRVQAQGFSAKGADASIQEQRVWLFPEIRINPAIRLRGEYWVTGTHLRAHHPVIQDGRTYVGSNYAVPEGYVGWFISGDGSGGKGPDPAGMSTGLWEKFWVTAHLPWGIFVAGRRGVPFGTGWSTFHSKDVDSDGWALIVPHGPLTFIVEQFLRDAGGDAFTENAAATIAGINVGGGASPTLAMGTDKNRTRALLNATFAFTYHAGPMDMGTLARVIYHSDTHTSLSGTVPAGANGADDFNNSAFPVIYLGAGTFLDNRTTPIYGDTRFVLWPTYFKYFNGTFFFNAEYDFEYGDASKKGGRPISTWADGWQIEFGVISGPAQLSLANFYHSGQDRRGGFTDFWGAVGGPTSYLHPGTSVVDKQTQFLVFAGAKEAIKPYQYLLGIYGTGNNSYDDRGYGTFEDFLAFAARVDYAVAANLNVFTSFMYASRASNTASPVAAYRGGVPNIGPRTSPGFAPIYNGHYTSLGALGAQTATVPNVPDNYLGWEWDAGVNWKLLEGLTFNGLFAYWQPGNWFKWAYVDYGSLNTAVINGTAYPVDPHRTIDAIIGFQGSVMVDF